jgi:N-acetylmuramate 1-kinase
MLEPTPTPSPVTWTDTARGTAFAEWLGGLQAQHRLLPATLRPASSDASFRRYLRVDIDGGEGSLIVMDAPPPQEDVAPFIEIAGRIERAGLHAPRVLASDAERGFVLLSDLGSTLYLQPLQEAAAAADTAQASRLMRELVATLVQWQQGVDATGLPSYDSALLERELELFPTWCVEREYGRSWNNDERATWQQASALLIESALAQPTLAVHRDYMPRNLMVTPQGPGILDFQDAVAGPINYDVASLIRDAFVSWDEEFELDVVVRYWQQARKAGLPLTDDLGEFWRQVEWMGLQRHLKVLGIFCRLKHRDGKPGYSADLPRFFDYAHRVARRYGVLRPLSRLIEPLMGAERVNAYY